MRLHTLLLVAGLVLLTATNESTAAPPAVHGSADAYAGRDVALAWGVLRGAREDATVAVIRVVVDPRVYAWIEVVGIDPFTQREQSFLPATRSDGTVDVRVARSRFADFPRTEFRFFDSSAATTAGTPTLVMFYLGVPDTTPEFTDPTKLDAYLAERIARERAANGIPSP